MKLLHVLLVAGMLLAGCATRQVTQPGVLVAAGEDTLFVREAILPTAGSARLPGASGWSARLKALPGSALDLVTGRPQDNLLSRPTDICLDGEGRAYICDGDLGQVLRLDPDGGRTLIHPQELVTPTGVELTPAGLVISDSGAGQVFLLGRFGLVDRRLQAPEPWLRPGQMHWNGDRLFVCDSGRHTVEVFDGQGNHQKSLGGPGSEEGRFLHPVAVASTSDGRIWVLDALNHRVQAFTPNLVYESSFGVYDRAPGGLMFPKGLAVDEEDHLYISDASTNRVQVFSPGGALLYWFGEAGRGEGQFLLPGALHAAGNRVYVADQYNRRVQVFRYLPLYPQQEEGAQP